MPLLRRLASQIPIFPHHRLFSTTLPKKKTLRTLRTQYEAGTPLTMLTAYDYPSALHADLAGTDLILVGDSLGMVVLGHRTTQSVTLDDMIHHARAARRGTAAALLIADLPFGSFESAPAQAVASATRLVKEAGVDAVKMEGGRSRQEVIRAVVDAGVAVMGHVGLMPQAVSRLGGFRAMGKSCAEATAVLDDARAVEQAGAFAVVVECVPRRLAEVVTRAVDIPTVGIGSGNSCDGQVLVYHDMLGILSHPHHAKVAPKFSKMFAELAVGIHDAIGDYCRQVRTREFPSEQYSPYAIPDDEFEQFLRTVKDDEGKEKSARRETEHSTSKRKGVSNSNDGKSEDISLY